MIQFPVELSRNDARLGMRDNSSEVKVGLPAGIFQTQILVSKATSLRLSSRSITFCTRPTKPKSTLPSAEAAIGSRTPVPSAPTVRIVLPVVESTKRNVGLKKVSGAR